MAALRASLQQLFLDPSGPYQLLLALQYQALHVPEGNFQLLTQTLLTRGQPELEMALKILRSFRQVLVTNLTEVSQDDILWLMYSAKRCQEAGLPYGRTLAQRLQELQAVTRQPKPPAAADKTVVAHRADGQVTGKRPLEILDGKFAGRKAGLKIRNGSTVLLEIEGVGKKWIRADWVARLC